MIFEKKAKANLAFLAYFDQFNFYVGLADFKMIISDFWTLFLDTE